MMKDIGTVTLTDKAENDIKLVPATYAATVKALGYDPLGLIEVKKLNWLQRMFA